MVTGIIGKKVGMTQVFGKDGVVDLKVGVVFGTGQPIDLETGEIGLHSTPTGPRAWNFPVAMPISAPKPNSPPSANWVEALCSTIAESTSLRNFCAALASSVTIASVWCDPKWLM